MRFHTTPGCASEAPTLAGARWQTGPWFVRDERLYLHPGDSPMGWRLPLDSLPWVSAADYPYHIEQDPSTPRDALPEGTALRQQYVLRLAAPETAARATAGS